MDSIEAGAERFRDRLNSETLFVQLHRPSSLRLRQWLTTHTDAMSVKQLEDTWFREAKSLGQSRRANTQSIQRHQLRDLLVSETTADEPGAAGFVQVGVGIDRHERSQLSQLL